jgi:hypothetical protein
VGLVSFANVVLPEWERLIDQFFQTVDRKRRECGMTEEQARDSLELGYGYEVAEAWDEWIS